MSEKKGGEGGGGEGEEEFSLIKSCPSSTEKAGKERICVGCPGQSFCLSSVATVDPGWFIFLFFDYYFMN